MKSDNYLLGEAMGESFAMRLARFFTGKSAEELRREIEAKRAAEQQRVATPLSPTAPPPYVAGDVSVPIVAMCESLTEHASLMVGAPPDRIAEAMWSAVMLATTRLNLPGGPALWAAQALLAATGDIAAAQTVLAMLCVRVQQGDTTPIADVAADMPATSPQPIARVVGGRSVARDERDERTMQASTKPARRHPFRVIRGGLADATSEPVPPTPTDDEPPPLRTA